MTIAKIPWPELFGHTHDL